jgi:hypothetical protein
MIIRMGSQGILLFVYAVTIITLEPIIGIAYEI